MAMQAINPYAIQMQQAATPEALADALMQHHSSRCLIRSTPAGDSVAVRRSPFEALAKSAGCWRRFIQNKNDQNIRISPRR